jgi:hypothetical protein
VRSADDDEICDTTTELGPFPTEFVLTSAYSRRHLRVGREPAARLFGIGEFAVNGDLEHTASRLVQRHLRAWRCPLNQASRRTGARFVASHATIFDLDLHELSPDLMKAPYMGELGASINPTWANAEVDPSSDQGSSSPPGRWRADA